jgi:hypothetical protein
MTNVTALLGAVQTANRAVHAVAAAPAAPGDQRGLRILTQAGPWLNEVGPAIAAAVPQSLVRFGSSFRVATRPSEIRAARDSAERGSFDYFAGILQRQVREASSARKRTEELLKLLSGFDDDFPATESRRQISAGLKQLHDLWQSIEGEAQTLTEHLTNPETRWEDIPGLSEFEIGRARQVWGALARFATNVQAGRPGSS